MKVDPTKVTTLNRLPVVIHRPGTYNLRNGGQAVIHEIKPYVDPEGKRDRLEVTAFEAKGSPIVMFRGKLKPHGYQIWHVSGRVDCGFEKPDDIVSRVPDNPEVYSKNGGTYCPACGSWNIVGHAVDIDQSAGAQEVHCDDCGAEWVDTYTLTGYCGLKGVETARVVEPVQPPSLKQQLAEYVTKVEQVASTVPGIWAKQVIMLERDFPKQGGKLTLKLSLDSRDPQHSPLNVFTITGEFDGVSGPLHAEIAALWPELAHLTKWHLASERGPLFYLDNTLYLARSGLLESARKVALWPDMPEKYLDKLHTVDLKVALEERLPGLIAAFARDMQDAGLKLHHEDQA